MAKMQEDGNRTSSWIKSLRQDFYTKGYITNKIRIQKEKSQKEIEIEEDTKRRKEIRKYIIKKHSEGKSKEEIFKRLIFVYGAQKYKKYHKYFKKWTEDFTDKKDSFRDER